MRVTLGGAADVFCLCNGIHSALMRKGINIMIISGTIDLFRMVINKILSTKPLMLNYY